MKISVVTVAYNSAATIRFTLESFLEQSWRDAELLVIDGGSADETVAIAREYDDPRLRIFSEPDRGLYDAMNKGLHRFDGDAVGFLNSDDRFHDRSALARIASGLEDADITVGHIDYVKDHRSSSVVRRWRGSPYRAGAFRAGWMPAHPTFYARRAVIERTGDFDLSYSIAADYDYMLRAIEAGPHGTAPKVAFIDAVLVNMMAGGVSNRSLRSYIRGNVEALWSRRQWLQAGVIDRALFAKPLGKVPQFVSRAMK